MKKTELIKGFLIILIGTILIGTTGVFADDEFDYIFDDPAENTTNNTNTNNSSSNKSNSNTNKSNSNTNKSNSNTNKSNSNTNSNNTNKSNTNTNNVSSYNNTSNNTNNLPKTGVEDAIPTMALIVVFGISAVYAYKKINDYNKL